MMKLQARHCTKFIRAMISLSLSALTASCGNGSTIPDDMDAAVNNYHDNPDGLVQDPAPVPPETAGPVPAPSIGAVPPADALRSVQLGVLELTNAFRAANGVAPLTLNDKLGTAAQGYAALMGTLGFFSHTSPDGSSAGNRITAAGYQWRTWGENIAYGYATANAVVTGWINSPGHRANLLNGKFKELGVGYFVGKSPTGRTGTPYWVQDFGAQ